MTVSLRLACLVLAGGLAATAPARSQDIPAGQSCGGLLCDIGVLGHKAALGVMALGPDLWRLQRLQADLTGAGLHAVNSYVSLTEVSEYARGMPPERLEPRGRTRYTAGRRPGESASNRVTSSATSAGNGPWARAPAFSSAWAGVRMPGSGTISGSTAQR